MPKLPFLTFNRGHRLFEPFLQWQLSNCALAHALQAIRYKKFIPAQSGMMFACKHLDTVIQMPLFGPLEELARGNEINHVVLFVLPKVPVKESDYDWTTGLEAVSSNMITTPLTGFMERQQKWCKDNISGDTKDWPELLNFARIIRNAAAHFGCLDIKNPNSSTYGWRGLSYGPKDDGRLVIGGDMTPPDVIMMMLDVSRELDRLGAPHL